MQEVIGGIQAHLKLDWEGNFITTKLLFSKIKQTHIPEANVWKIELSGSSPFDNSLTFFRDTQLHNLPEGVTEITDKNGDFYEEARKRIKDAVDKATIQNQIIDSDSENQINNGDTEFNNRIVYTLHSNGWVGHYKTKSAAYRDYRSQDYIEEKVVTKEEYASFWFEEDKPF